MREKCFQCFRLVHGGIRHLENIRFANKEWDGVHGGIRHLEMLQSAPLVLIQVHGGIRHLEIE